MEYKHGPAVEFVEAGARDLCPEKIRQQPHFEALKLAGLDKTLTHQFTQIVGPDWDKIRIAVIGNQIVFMLGSDLTLFETTIKNVQKGESGLATTKRLAAFQWATETGMSTSPITSAGGGRELYTQLLRRLTERGYRQAFAGITQPNEASNGFHRSFGFQDAGFYRRVAWKHDSWHDVAWMQLDLLGTADQDGPPDPIV